MGLTKIWTKGIDRFWLLIQSRRGMKLLIVKNKCVDS